MLLKAARLTLSFARGKLEKSPKRILILICRKTPRGQSRRKINIFRQITGGFSIGKSDRPLEQNFPIEEGNWKLYNEKPEQIRTEVEMFSAFKIAQKIFCRNFSEELQHVNKIFVRIFFVITFYINWAVEIQLCSMED